MLINHTTIYSGIDTMTAYGHTVIRAYGLSTLYIPVHPRERHERERHGLRVDHFSFCRASRGQYGPASREDNTGRASRGQLKTNFKKIKILDDKIKKIILDNGCTGAILLLGQERDCPAGRPTNWRER